jgi:hypothetical protein
LGNLEEFYVEEVTLYNDWVNCLGCWLLSTVRQAAAELDK